jgi:hypothetical protein
MLSHRVTKIKMAGVAGLEPVTSAVTGQRSNQLSYTPAKGNETLKKVCRDVKFWLGSFLADKLTVFFLEGSLISNC